MPRRASSRRANAQWPRFDAGSAARATGTDLVDGAIERLLELGILDDEAFARAWVESRDRARPRGERAIREELRLKGIDRATIDAVLEDRRERGRCRAGSRRRRAPPRTQPTIPGTRRRPAAASGAGLCAAGSERLRSRRVPRGRSAVRGARRPGGCARKPLMPGTARDRRGHLRTAPIRPRWRPRPSDDRDHGHAQRFGPPSRYSPRDSSRPGTCPDISELRGRGEADRW